MRQDRNIRFTLLHALSAHDTAAFINGLGLPLFSHNGIGRTDLSALTAAGTNIFVNRYYHAFALPYLQFLVRSSASAALIFFSSRSASGSTILKAS